MHVHLKAVFEQAWEEAIAETAKQKEQQQQQQQQQQGPPDSQHLQADMKSGRPQKVTPAGAAQEQDRNMNGDSPQSTTSVGAAGEPGAPQVGNSLCLAACSSRWGSDTRAPSQEHAGGSSSLREGAWCWNAGGQQKTRKVGTQGMGRQRWQPCNTPQSLDVGGPRAEKMPA